MSVMRRRPPAELVEVDTEGSWAISYGDMITLLLTFFILFFSTDPQRDRMESMSATLMARLSGAKDRAPQALSGGQDATVDQNMKEKLAAEVHKVGPRLIIEFPEISFFDLGAVKLTKAGEQELKKFVGRFQPFAGNYLVGIRAYTDNKKVIPWAGRKYSDNLELSALRSIATMRVLQKYGIPLHRMRLGGYGELNLTAEDLSRAIASTPEYPHKGLALARKIVLVIEPEPRETL